MAKISWRDVPVTNRSGAVTGEARLALLREYRDSGVMAEAWPCSQADFDGPWNDDGPRASGPAPEQIDWAGLGDASKVYTLRVKDAPGQPVRDLTADAETLEEAREEAKELVGQGFIGGSVALFEGVPDYSDAPVALFRCEDEGVIELEA
jgi:hypothetical protein